jgi:hypothetical protein
MKRAILSLLCASGIACATLSASFAGYINGQMALTEEVVDQIYAQYRSEFPNAVRLTEDRRSTFENNLRKVAAHNKVGNTWAMGLNEYSLLTEEEFFEHFNIKANQNCSATNRPAASQNIEEILRGVPASWNWRDFGVVTPVKN